MHELADQLLSHLRAGWRYRWHAAICAWIIATAGWTVVHLIADRYRASARVYVDTQSVLRPLLSGLAVQPNLNQTVSMLGRTLVNRVNVEKVVQMSGMEAGISNPAARERLIAELTKEIDVISGGGENLYTIAYADRSRERAKRVVESLLTIFMQESLGTQRSDTVSAREFIEEQLKSYSDKLVAAEKAVTEFKRRHQGLMPGEGRDYYGRLSDAKSDLRKASLELREAIDARDAIKQQLASEAKMPAQAGDRPATVVPASELDVRIAALQRKLDDLRLVYTEQHPDVIANEHLIAQLRKQKKAEETRQGAPADGGQKATPASQSLVYEQLTISLATAEAKVAAMKARVAEYEIRYKELQAAANALPEIEAEYAQLTRDYQVIKTRYNHLLERRESAQISGDVETSNVGMGFRVVDPPRVSLKPSWPNRPKLVTAVLLLSLAGGFGLAFALSQVRPTFNDERSLRQASGLHVLGSIAMTWNEKQKKRHALGTFSLVLSFLGLLSVYGTILTSLIRAAAGV